MNIARPALPAVILALLINATLTAEPWTRFRGPNGTGISEAKTIPVNWTDEDYNWTAELPGVGHSSPVMWKSRLFVTSSDNDASVRFLFCIDTADGSIQWRREFPFTEHRKHKNNSFASSTPAVDDRHVYVIWQENAESLLIALDHDGEEKWRFDLGPFKGGHGPAASPIVYENMVVVCNDHEGPSYLLAVNRMTGKEQWRVPRSGTGY